MRIYVGNLPYTYDDQELASLFKTYGEVASARIVLDRESGRSRGFGFVEMPDENAARTAMGGMDGHRIDGRPLQVNEARPSAAHTGGAPRRDRDGGGGPPGGYSSGPRPPRSDRSSAGSTGHQGGGGKKPNRSYESERRPSRGRNDAGSSDGGWDGSRGGRRRGGQDSDWEE